MSGLWESRGEGLPRWLPAPALCSRPPPSPGARAPRRGHGREPLSLSGLLADGQSEICVVAGGVVTDFDGDGMLDLILSHGESMAQPLSVFRGNQVCMDPGTHGARPCVLPWV